MDWHSKLGLTEEETVAQVAAEESSIQEVSIDTQTVHDACKNSLDFLAGIAMPTVFKYLFPPVYQSVWLWLLSFVHKTRDFSQLALGLPRGFGKTSLIKIFLLYVILFTSKKFILVICENQTKANNIISDVMDMLDESNIKSVFGDWKIGAETDRQDLKKFGFRGRNIILMGAGADSGIRGIVLKNERPDVMLFDDIQSREDANSEVISRQKETWMIGTAMKAKSPHGCLFIFIANMYPTKHSILRKLKTNPNWTKFIAGGITVTPGGKASSLWEDLQPLEQLLREYENDLAAGHPEIFFAEVLNDENATVNTLIDISKIPEYDIPEDEIHNGSFVIIDPATDKKDSDAISLGYFEVFTNTPVLKEVTEGRLSPGETITEALRMCLTHNCRLVCIESNSYQYTLGYWFNYICAQRGISGIDAVELYSGMSSKTSRILFMFKALIAGETKYHPNTAPAVNLQISQFNPIKRDNVDGILDLLTYAPKVIELYEPLLTASTIIEDQEFKAIKVLDAEETCDF